MAAGHLKWPARDRMTHFPTLPHVSTDAPARFPSLSATFTYLDATLRQQKAKALEELQKDVHS
jgi:hypothetical protein